MRILALLLLAALGGATPEHPGYWPLSSKTSIVVQIDQVGTWEAGAPQQSYITLYGNGLVRITDDSSRHGWTTRHDWVAPVVPVELLDELSQLDFLNLKCEQRWDIDHFTAVDLKLVAPGGTHEVSLINCPDDTAARLRPTVDMMERIAKRSR